MRGTETETSSEHGKPGSCITCPVIRPDTTARLPHQPPVCDGDRRLLGRWLSDIDALVEDLTNPEDRIVDDRRYERWIRDHRGQPRSLGDTWADPLAALGGVAPINSRSSQPSVTGSRERPLPINTTAVDLTTGRRVHNLTGDAWPEDQIGHLSAATVLDEWIRHIRELLLPDHHLPPATPGDMVRWLRTRLDLVCNQYPQVPDLAESLRVLRSALRAAAGETEPQPQPCIGVACPRCDLKTLMTVPEDDYRAQCGNCGTLLTDDEYADIVGAQDTFERSRRTAREVHELLRRV